ncbi:hypothetical protein FH609_017850 [Streptomyces sp. 3MP-14]|uniref:Uncharacterized protein n=1 Tax=Streptomyces mimosae TaxID=2586635 RepID=A0A5N6A724_9ACTN|nr:MULTISPECIES: hypothetical protein [Streptomyces]KAB8164587.1 hypothetical protein FH607_015175 [Streptomyces mimosae]KAB8175503.1 hypothetical protein FH609_017850 [Streptomyces sp. 3MP-14]
MPTEDISAAEGEAAARLAASRRSLLRRLHMPVGKAIALAAMPSAALLGMGFTSPLAKADPQPENPFAGEACVEMPDEPPAGVEAEEAEETDASSEDEGAAEAGSEEPPAEEAGGSEEPPVAEEPAEPPADEAPVAPPEEEPAPEEPPADEEPAEPPADEEPQRPNPWDPLGLGEGLAELGEGVWDLLTPGERAEYERAQREAEAEAERQRQAEAEAAAEAEAEREAAARAEEEAERQRREEEQAAAEEAERQRQAEAEAEAEAEREAAEREEAEAAEREAEEAAEAERERREEERAAAEDEAAEDDREIDADTIPGAGEPFPCPEELRVPGDDEQTAFTLPDESWYLDATYLTLRGLSYHGVVNVTTASGNVKQVLKFTADKLDIGDLHQIVDAPGGVRYHVATAPGSNSTFRDGTVTMYTERLEGNLFGVIPVVFDAEHQPPLDLPIAHFTDVFVTQAGQFGGTLSMQGMHSYTTADGPTVP